MKTQPHSTYRDQNSATPHSTHTLDQSHLPRKRKTPDSVVEQESGLAQSTPQPPKYTLKLKVPSRTQPWEQVANQNNSSAAPNAEQAMTPTRSHIRLKFSSSGDQMSSKEKSGMLHEVMADGVVGAETIMSSIPESATMSADILAAADALIKMNSDWHESSEPELKRRKTIIAKEAESDDIELNSDEMERILREHQADIKRNLSEAFYAAVRNNDVDSLERCVLWGGVGPREIKENSVCQIALLIMMAAGSHQAVGELIKLGLCTKFLSDQEGLAHLNWVVGRGDWRMARVLLNSTSGNSELHSTLVKLLHDAMLKPDYTAVKTLLRAGMPGCQINASGKTMLAELVQALAANVQRSKISNQSVNPDYFRIIARLIKSGVDINQSVDPFKSTLLHKAYEFGYREHISWLLSKGANPELKNARQQTPRDLAVAVNERLYQYSAYGLQGDQFDPNRSVSRQARSVSVLQAAVMPPPVNIGVPPAENQNTSKAAQGNRDQPEARIPPLTLALLQGNATLAKQLLIKGEDPWIVRPGIRLSAFATAAMKGQLDILSQVMARDDFELHKNVAGVDALCAAVGSGQVEAARRLVIKGVPVLKNGSEGRSAMGVLSSTPSVRANREMLSVLFDRPS